MQDCRGTWPVCGTLMPSKEWKSRFEDHAQSKQRWYCVDCGSRYMIKYGMLVEFHCKGISTFMLAECSNTDVEDILAAYWEGLSGAADAEEIYEQLMVELAMDPKEILRPATEAEVKVPGVDYKQIMKILDPAALNTMARWNWDQILVLMQQPI